MDLRHDIIADDDVVERNLRIRDECQVSDVLGHLDGGCSLELVVRHFDEIACIEIGRIIGEFRRLLDLKRLECHLLAEQFDVDSPSIAKGQGDVLPPHRGGCIAQIGIHLRFKRNIGLNDGQRFDRQIGAQCADDGEPRQMTRKRGS